MDPTVEIRKRGPTKNPNAKEIRKHRAREKYAEKKIARELAECVRDGFPDVFPVHLTEAMTNLVERVNEDRRASIQNQKTQKRKRKRKREEILDNTGTVESTETPKLQTEPRFIMQLHPDLAHKYENFEEMRKLPRVHLLNRFMANSFKGLICYGIVVEYDRGGDRYLVAYDDREKNYVPWTSLSWLILSERHVDKAKIIQLRNCVEHGEYIQYKKITNTMGSL
jgi:hypothetical protein